MFGVSRALDAPKKLNAPAKIQHKHMYMYTQLHTLPASTSPKECEEQQTDQTMVGGFNSSEILVSWDDYPQYLGKKHIPNHQPELQPFLPISLPSELTALDHTCMGRDRISNSAKRIARELWRYFPWKNGTKGHAKSDEQVLFKDFKGKFFRQTVCWPSVTRVPIHIPLNMSQWHVFLQRQLTGFDS